MNSKNVLTFDFICTLKHSYDEKIDAFTTVHLKMYTVEILILKSLLIEGQKRKTKNYKKKKPYYD